jgi:hypothetical protein
MCQAVFVWSHEKTQRTPELRDVDTRHALRFTHTSDSAHLTLIPVSPTIILLVSDKINRSRIVYLVRKGVAFVGSGGEAGLYNMLELRGHKGALELLADGDSLIPLDFRLPESPVQLIPLRLGREDLVFVVEKVAHS